MFSKKKVFKLLICVWGVLLIALPFTCFTKAETSDNFAGHWYVWEENINISGNQWISYQNVLFVTNDPLAMGQVQVNNTTSGPNNFVQTLDFSGTYTFYSHLFEQPFTLTNGLMPVATSNSRAFTTYTPIQSAHNVEVVQLSSTQIQSLISAIQSSSSYDDTNLLTQLAIIKGVLDNIDTSASSAAADIASLLNTSNSILNALNNIDNAIDMISWNDAGYAYGGYSLTLNGTYDDALTSLNVSDVTDVYFKISKNSGSSYLIDLNSIIKITLPWWLRPDRISSFEIINGQTGGSFNGYKYYIQSGYFKTDIYIYDFATSSNPYDLRLHLKFSRASSINRRQFATYGSYYIVSNDIEYWTLKSYFEQHNYYQNEYPDLVDEQDDFNNEVDNYLTEEDALISDFQQAISNPAIAPSIPNANPSNWGNTFIQSIAFLGVVFNTLTGAANGGNAFYLMIQFSLMLGMALLIIGKKAS